MTFDKRLVVLRGGSEGCAGCGGRGWVLVSRRRKIMQDEGPIRRALCSDCQGIGASDVAEAPGTTELDMDIKLS